MKRTEVAEAASGVSGMTSRREPESALLPAAMKLLLAAVAFAAFLSDTKFVPGIKNNVGPFEVVALLFLTVGTAWFAGERYTLRFHPALVVMGAWVITAATSLFVLRTERFSFGLLHLVILAFQLFFIFVLYNVLRVGGENPRYFLRVVALSTLVVGTWVLVDQLAAGGRLNAAGPFRNRSHMGIYMHNAFWMVMAYLHWPAIGRIDRGLLRLALPLTLYAVAASGRQSVYVGLVAGLVAMLAGALFSRVRGARSILATGVALAMVAALFYTVGARYSPNLAFFRLEVETIDQKFAGLTAAPDDETIEERITSMQRAGALEAGRDHPILGIGWGGFLDSQYSPTGHEMHSTPLRFLAELGITGLALYALFVGLLVSGAVRVFMLVRDSPHGPTMLVFVAALVATVVGHYYNRMFTDRVFWLWLGVYLATERALLAEAGQAIQRPARSAARLAARPRPRPASAT
jgi:hypothetical protein